MTSPLSILAAGLGGVAKRRDDVREEERRAALDAERAQGTALQRAVAQMQLDEPERKRTEQAQRQQQVSGLIQRLNSGDDSAYPELASVAPDHPIVRQRAERDFALPKAPAAPRYEIKDG